MGGTSFSLFRPVVFKLLKDAIFETEKWFAVPSLSLSLSLVALCQTHFFL
jgi:hypothetical protein